MARVRLDTASEADDLALRRLLAANPMQGRIALAFEREPSYFAALRVQGPLAQVLVGRDAETGEAVAVASRSVKPLYVNGRPRDVGYLADLRVGPAYRGRTVLARGYRLLQQLHADGRTDLYYTVIAADNAPALSTIAAGRAGLPAYRDLGLFNSPAVSLGRAKPVLRAGVELADGELGLLDAIVACLNEHGAAKQFAPVYARRDFEPDGRLADIAPGDFVVALRGGRVVGTVAYWDQTAFKQTRVVAYRGGLRLLRPLVNASAPLLGWPRLPRPGAHLRSFYAACVAVEGNDPAIFAALLRHLYNRAVGGPHAFFVLGLHERDPLAAALDDYRCSAYRGRLFAVHFADGERAYRALDGRIPHVEVATL
jgi:hypothetical protein